MIKKLMIWALAVALLLVALGVGYSRYMTTRSLTLSGEEEIQPITGRVKVTSPRDTSVIFIEVKTGDNYAIPYIAAGQSETIKLKKGEWYRIEDGAGLTLQSVNARIG